jgi:hypothetical protein
MHKLKIYGASDDLIEIEGEGKISDEFNWYQNESKAAKLAVSDGTLLSVIYDNDGIWRISKLASGTAEFHKVEGDVEADTNDEVTLHSETPFKWVVLGEQATFAK